MVTLAVDESDAAALSADERYRLVTTPARPGVERAFASLLGAADETLYVVASPAAIRRLTERASAD